MKTILYILLIFIFICCNQNTTNNQTKNNTTNEVKASDTLNNYNENNQLGIFSYQISSDNIVRFKENNHVFTRKEFLNILSNNNQKYDDLRILINKVIVSNSPNYPHSLKLKSPPINKDNEDKDFFWLIQKQHFNYSTVRDTYKNYLIHCQHSFINGDINSDDYKERFIGIVSDNNFYEKNNLKLGNTYKNAAVIFNNTFAKDRLIIPCPLNTNINYEENKSLLNISSYMKLLNKNLDNNDYQERNNNFWLAIGLSTKNYPTNISDTIFLTTHGTGVYYFHFRIDSFAYDYNDIAIHIKSEPQASDFYQKQKFN